MHEHRWRKVYEENLFGGPSCIGWECVDCNEYVSINALTPAGLSGTVLEKSARLVGPLGGIGETSSGKRYREQIVDEDGKLTIIE